VEFLTSLAKEPYAKAPLIAGMKTHEHVAARLEAAKLLAKQASDKQVLAALIEVSVTDSSPDVRQTAGTPLWQSKDPAIFETRVRLFKETKDPQVRKRIVDRLQVKEDPKRAAEILMEALRNEDTYSSAHSRLQGMISAETKPVFVKGLKDPNLTVRRLCANVLARLDDPSIGKHYVALLDDDNMWVRRKAIEVLRRYPQSEALEPLLMALYDRNEWVAGEAALALGAMKDKRAVKPLMKILKDGRRRGVLGPVSRALGFIGDERAVDLLIEMLKVHEAQSGAADALGRIGGDKAVEALITQYEPGVAGGYESTVREALARTRHPKAMEALRGGLATHGQSPETLKVLAETDPGKTVEVLLEKLNRTKGDPHRWMTIHSLSQINDERALKAVIELFNDDDTMIQTHAKMAIAENRDPLARKLLIKALKDERAEVRANAAFALGVLRHPDAVEPLLEVLRAEKNKGVLISVQVALDGITRRDRFGDRETPWPEWWKKNREQVYERYRKMEEAYKREMMRRQSQ